MKIAIIFPVFNGLSYTKNCLRSLYGHLADINSSEITFEIVIVDDGSRDKTADWIRSNFPEVHLLYGDGNLWWSGGINKAIKFGMDTLNTDYFIWWNNDIIADDQYFNNVITLLKENTPGTIIGSKIMLAQKPDTIWSMGGLFDPGTGKKSMIGTHRKNVEEFNQRIACDWLTGMGTITHHSVYRKIGLLDEKKFPQYHGDSDFTFRARKAGYTIVVDPSLIIYNDTGNTGIKHDESFKRLAESLFTIRSNYNIKKDFIFYKKHSNSPMAYLIPIKKYLKYIGGFLKWKFFGFFGLKRPNHQ